MICQNCGAEIAAHAKFCLNCGATLGQPGTPPVATVSQSLESLASAVKPTAKSLLESLARLGINFSRKQIIGFVISLIGGMIMARILPFIYPIFDPILTVVFGAGPGAVRDGFNTNMMTLITFFTSFGLSFATMLVTKTRKS